MNLKPLTDDALLARLESLAQGERECVADIVEHLAEADRREIVIDRGYETLFEYCRKRLGYSEAAAFLRIRAARAASRFPRVLDDLRSGALHLDAVMRLYPLLSDENCDHVLAQASGASKKEVLQLVARISPSAPVVERDVVRHLPAAPPIQNPPPCSGESPSPSAAASSSPESSSIIPPPSRVRLAFTADDEFLLMSERLKSLRRNKYPAGRMEDLLKEAITVMLERIDPDRKRIRRARTPARRQASRLVPKAIKMEVWKRDEGRCAYESDGRRCESRSRLEYDHILPWALGGRSDRAENIRLLCRPHNQRLARRRFGPRRRARLV